MKALKELLTSYLTTLKQNGVLEVCYALLAETLILGFLGWSALFTIETLLPTFVTVRFSLTQFFSILVLLTFVLSVLGHFLGISFESKINKKNLWLWIGLVWTLFILTISLYKFPPFTTVLIIVAFFFIGFLFYRIFFGQKENDCFEAHR